MNDNTIIRIKVPARLYESVKAKLMVKEETSQLQKLEEAKAKIEKMISEAKDSKKATPADLERSKKITASLEKREKAEREKEDRMIAAAMAKKKADTEAKKVADKKAADKKKADEKKK